VVGLICGSVYSIGGGLVFAVLVVSALGWVLECGCVLVGWVFVV